MIRLYVLLLITSGCDRVFSFDLPEVPQFCGPYGPPAQLVFSPDLKNPRDFSVDGTGELGLVHATRTNADGITWTGPHAIERDGSGRWIPDDTRDRPILDDLHGAHIVETGHVFGWIDGSTAGGSSVQEYEFIAGARLWNQVPGLIDSDIAANNHVGNVIQVPFGDTTSFIQFLVEIKLQRSGDPRENQIFIFQRFPTQDWQLTSQANPLNSVDERIDPTAGVLTTDHEKLVYAARVGDLQISQLFATERDDNTFLPGYPLRIEGVPADADLTEPWIDKDCRTLYFRWNDATWKTTALDDSLLGQ